MIAAYLNFARFMIDTFQPDYFAYGIEVNCSTADPDAPEFAAYLTFAQQVYAALKAKHPDLPIFHTLCTGSFDTDSLDVLMETGRRALAYSDYVAFMLQSLNDLDAEFVAWFVPRDYDALYEQLDDMGLASPAWLIWRDNGLWEGAGNPRPALAV